MSFFSRVRGETETPEESDDSTADKPSALDMPERKPADQMLARTFQTDKVNIYTPRRVLPDGSVMVGDDAEGTNAIKAVGSSLSINELMLDWYSAQGFIGYSACAMLAQNWLIAKACTMPAEDAARNGYDITLNSGDEIDAGLLQRIREYDKLMHVSNHLVEAGTFARVFGIRVVLFEVESDDPAYYEKPFNIDGVKPGAYKGISQIDPYWITPELDNDAAANPASRHFYEPTWWRCGGKRYHRSHLCVIIPKPVSDLLKPTYLFGGMSVPQLIYERVYGAERTTTEAPLLVQSKRLNVLHVDLTKAAAKQGVLMDRILQFCGFRDNHGVQVVGTNDVVEQFDTSLTDLDTVIMTQYQIVAGAAEVPATKLLGTSPKGFNSNGQGEADNYHEKLESIQSHEYEPLLERHYALLDKSFNLGLGGVSIEWKPCDSPTAAELADIRLKNSQAAAAYANAGAIDGQDIRTVLISDPSSGFNGLDESVPEDAGLNTEEDDGQTN